MGNNLPLFHYKLGCLGYNEIFKKWTLLKVEIYLEQDIFVFPLV